MVTPELIDYIRQSRAAGTQDAQIKSALLASGWAVADINEAFGPDPSATVNYLEKPLMSLEDKFARVRYAGFWIRVLSMLIDGLIIFIPAFILGLIAAGSGLNESVAKFFVAIIVIGFFLHMIMKYQATPGKMVFGLIIVSDDLGRITLAQALLREIVGKFLSSLAFDIGYIMVAFTQKKQGLHDMIAKTLVVYKDE